MREIRFITSRFLVLSCGWLLLASCAYSNDIGSESQSLRAINSSIIVAPQETRNISNINGKVQIGEGMLVGHIDTVNGRIGVAKNAVVESIKTVNGRIKIEGGQVSNNITSVNGRIHLVEAHVNGNVQTVNGGINLDSSTIEGDVIVKKSFSFPLFNWTFSKPKVVIGPNTQINGSIIAQRNIRLYIHESASIGDIVGAYAIIYKGEKP